MKKPAITQVPIDKTLAERWSGRAYDASKSVSKEQTIALLEAARWAPSCMGDQPWRIVVFNKAEDVAAWQKAFDCLVEGNQNWVKNAPWLVLICADTLFSKNIDVRGHALQQLKDILAPGLPAGQEGLTASQSLKGIIDSEQFTKE